MIGKPWRPTDVDNEFGIIGWLGYPVRAEYQGEVYEGTLADVKVDGEAALTDYREIVIALVPAETVRLNLSGAWSG